MDDGTEVFFCEVPMKQTRDLDPVLTQCIRCYPALIVCVGSSIVPL